MPASPVDSTSQRVAVLLPCYNEAITIGKVVADFRAALPDAIVYVFDNNVTPVSSPAMRPPRSCDERT